MTEVQRQSAVQMSIGNIASWLSARCHWPLAFRTSQVRCEPVVASTTAVTVDLWHNSILLGCGLAECQCQRADNHYAILSESVHLHWWQEVEPEGQLWCIDRTSHPAPLVTDTEAGNSEMVETGTELVTPHRGTLNCLHHMQSPGQTGGGDCRLT